MFCSVQFRTFSFLLPPSSAIASGSSPILSASSSLLYAFLSLIHRCFFRLFFFSSKNRLGGQRAMTRQRTLCAKSAGERRKFLRKEKTRKTRNETKCQGCAQQRGNRHTNCNKHIVGLRYVGESQQVVRVARHFAWNQVFLSPPKFFFSRFFTSLVYISSFSLCCASFSRLAPSSIRLRRSIGTRPPLGLSSSELGWQKHFVCNALNVCSAAQQLASACRCWPTSVCLVDNNKCV